jgi:hypothetical protein
VSQLSFLADLSLPNAVSWFYFSFVLAISFFFQFSRWLAQRNFDLIMLFVFVPGYLLLQESYRQSGLPGSTRTLHYVGYGWLLLTTLLWAIRCFLDYLPLRRPLVSPNLSVPGLLLLSSGLLVCIVGVAYSRSVGPWGSEDVGKTPIAITSVKTEATSIVSQSPVASGSAHADVQFWVERTLSTVCHGLVLVGLFMIGWKVFGDVHTGVAAGMLYLLFPGTAYFVSQLHHVWPAVLLTWAIFWYRRPSVAGLLLGIATGTTFFPLLLLPVWMHFYRPKGTGRFLMGFSIAAAVSLGTTLGLLTAADQLEGIWQTLHLTDWQPWKSPRAESIWVGAHWAYRVPLFVISFGFVITSFLWPPVRNLGHLIAISAAVLMSIQFWFADRGGVYVIWYLPYLLLMILRPSLIDHGPVDPGPWPTFVRRLLPWDASHPEPKSPVA